MPIYMKADALKGDVTTKGYEQTIELNSVNFSIAREIRDAAVNREVGKPQFSGVIFHKQTDSSSSELLTHLLTGKVIPTLQLFVCSSENSKQPHVTYTFENAIISQISEDLIKEGLPHESLRIRFSKYRKRFHPMGVNNRQTSPSEVGYDLETSTLA